MPALSLFLVGAPRSGKTSVFEALTMTPAGPHFAAKGPHRIGAVHVPDARLAALRALFQPKKYVPAEVTFVDVALPPTSDTGEASFRQMTAFLGEADAMAIVVQAFGDMDYKGRPLDPVAQLDSILLELALADLEKIDRKLERMQEDRQRGLRVSEVEYAVLQRFKAQLESGRLLQELELREDEEKQIRAYAFLTRKPMLVIANVGEDDPAGKGREALVQAAVQRGFECLSFCAPLEAEIARLAPEEQGEFLRNYDLEAPASIRLIRSAYTLLNLISFYTVGEDEVRAWTLRWGSNAQTAAGRIHSDMEKGFIRAEVVDADTLLAEGSLSACRAKNALRLEGKSYLVREGDVFHVRFNV